MVARSYSGRKKRLMWRWLREADIMSATCLHATGDHEREDIRAMGYEGPIAVIPNAVAIPQQKPEHKHRKLRRLVYLARIHPIKGTRVLIDLWRNLATEFPDWELDIAGVDDGGHVAKLKAHVAKLKLKRIKFSGPRFGEEKSRFLFSADLYCLPTTSDNFAITVGEALAHQLPVVTTKATPWEGVVTHRCGWWEEPNSEAVGRALRQAMAKSHDELEEMGLRGKHWISNDFGINPLGQRMSDLYQWLIFGGEAPHFVSFS